MNRLLKRSLDIICAAAALLILAPVFGLVAVLIRVDSSGSAFFRQERLGRAGSTFRVLKFRTMIEGAQDHPLGMKTGPSDPRITRIGRWLRRFSIDELPQLINVFRGEMSLVGPRPAPVSHLERYSPSERRRLDVAPGITGLAQVEGRNALTWQERIEYDLCYVDNRSLWLDLRILLRTVGAVSRSTGVYSGRNERLINELTRKD